jgi:hypothetical protein
MTANASYCEKCDHKSVCKIRQQIVDFDTKAKQFEADNQGYKLTIINVNYSCIYKEAID